MSLAEKPVDTHLQNGSISDHNEDSIQELKEDWGDEYNDVVTFLCGLHLNEYVEMFVDQGIKLDIFLNLNEEDLCHIGMTNSKHRAVLLQGISKLTKNKLKKSANIHLENLSPEEVNIILTNTLKHSTVMHASLAFMRFSLRKTSVHNKRIDLKHTSAELLELLASEADIQAQLVMNQVNAILAKNVGASDKNPKSALARRWKFNMCMVTGIGVVCGVLFYISKVL